MDANRFAEAFEHAISLAGSERLLAEGTGYSQVAINKARRRRHCTSEMALAIDHFLGGRVSASSLRPDLWQKPEHVPPARPRGVAA